MAESVVAAIDNGGTTTRVDIRRQDDKLGTLSYPTPHDYETAVWRLGESVSQLTEYSGTKVEAVGMAVAGAVSGDQITDAGELKEYGWVGLPFRQDVAESIRVNPDHVVLMNDCEAAAKAQQVANREAGFTQPGYIATISTGFGGAGFTSDSLIVDEPGHEFLKLGAVCGCGAEGCVEAHISGAGIARKFGVAASKLDAHGWEIVTSDAVEAHVQMINRLTESGHPPAIMHYFGSVAMKAPGLLSGLQAGLTERREELPVIPVIAFATHGDNSGLVGAGDAAIELLS